MFSSVQYMSVFAGNSLIIFGGTSMDILTLPIGSALPIRNGVFEITLRGPTSLKKIALKTLAKHRDELRPIWRVLRESVRNRADTVAG